MEVKLTRRCTGLCSLHCREAEARADVDGLVALQTAFREAAQSRHFLGGQNEITARFHASATMADCDAPVCVEARALLAGDKAEFGTDAHDLPFEAGDKAEAPE